MRGPQLHALKGRTALGISAACLVLVLIGTGLLLGADGNGAGGAAQPVAQGGASDIALVMHCPWGTGPGEIGKMDAEFAYGPKTLRIDAFSGRIVLVDGVGNARLQLFDSTGHFLRAIPFREGPSIHHLALSYGNMAYLSDGFDVWEADLGRDEITKLGTPGGMFAGIHGLAVSAPFGSDRILFLARSIVSLEDFQPWVVGYDSKLQVRPGIAGSSPVTTPIMGILYVISSVAADGEGSIVTVKRWHYGGSQGVRSVSLRLPVPAALGSLRLVGATENPAWVYVRAHARGRPGPDRVWKYDWQGNLLGVLDLGDGKRAELPGLEGGCAYAADLQGIIYVWWCHPTEGFYLGKVASAARWGVPPGPPPPPGTNLPAPPAAPGGPPPPPAG